jgi:hypothetical protein
MAKRHLINDSHGAGIRIPRNSFFFLLQLIEISFVDFIILKNHTGSIGTFKISFGENTFMAAALFFKVAYNFIGDFFF